MAAGPDIALQCGRQKGKVEGQSHLECGREKATGRWLGIQAIQTENHRTASAVHVGGRSAILWCRIDSLTAL